MSSQTDSKTKFGIAYFFRNKMNLKFFTKICLTLSLFGLFGGNTAWGCGETSTVLANTQIPAGWVVTSKQLSGGQWYWGIKNLSGVNLSNVPCYPLHSTETVVAGESPIPTGWVITGYNYSGGISYAFIENLNGAPFLDALYVVAGDSPIPTNWVVTATSTGGGYAYNYIKCLAGAPYLDIESVIQWSPRPNGWVVISSSGIYYNIQNTNRVLATITTPSSNITVASGASVFFAGSGTDTATGATLSYSWNFGDGYTATGATASHIYNNTGTTSATYTATFKATDKDNYYGTATRSITINPVPEAPAITMQPANQTVNAGSTASFSVTASGTAPLSYQWRKNGTNIFAATAASYTLSTTTADNGSTFSVVVSNSVGSVTSNNATLTVISVAVSVNPQSFAVAGETSYQCIATVTGATNQAVTWTAQPGSSINKQTGLFSATPGNWWVTATSVADPSKSAMGWVEITPVNKQPPPPPSN